MTKGPIFPLREARQCRGDVSDRRQSQRVHRVGGCYCRSDGRFASASSCQVRLVTTCARRRQDSRCVPGRRTSDPNARQPQREWAHRNDHRPSRERSLRAVQGHLPRRREPLRRRPRMGPARAGGVLSLDGARGRSAGGDPKLVVAGRTYVSRSRWSTRSIRRPGPRRGNRCEHSRAGRPSGRYPQLL